MRLDFELVIVHTSTPSFPAKGGMKPVRHVTEMGHSKAVALRDQLNTTGDRECEDGVRPGSPITIPDREEQVMGNYREAPNTQRGFLEKMYAASEESRNHFRR
jgi:hypothetical protein